MRDQQQYLRVLERKQAEPSTATTTTTTTADSPSAVLTHAGPQPHTSAPAGEDTSASSTAATTTSAPTPATATARTGSSSAHTTPPTPRRVSSRAMKLDMCSNEQIPGEAISSIRRSRSNSYGHTILAGRSRSSSYGHTILSGSASSRVLGSASADMCSGEGYGEGAAERLQRDVACDTQTAAAAMALQLAFGGGGAHTDAKRYVCAACIRSVSTPQTFLCQ